MQTTTMPPITCCNHTITPKLFPEYHTVKYKCKRCRLDITVRYKTAERVAQFANTQPTLADGMTLAVLEKLTNRYRHLVPKQ